MGRRKRGESSFEDQYGEGMMSQDRTERPSFSAKSNGGFTGGGSAGGSKKDSNIQVVRSVPKFLQGHMHLLGRKPAEQEEEAQLATVDEQEDAACSEEDEKEALEAAVRENPDLAKQYPELQHVADSAAASQAKEAGNRAFVAKSYEEAALHFSEALRLRQDPIFYSNRAAAYHALKRYSEAAEDARQVIAKDRQWVKGWSRLAAALFAMEEWSEAKDAYAEAVKLEPSDATLQAMWHSAEINETKQEAEGKVKYKKSRAGVLAAKKGVQSSASRLPKNKTLLSFDEDADDS